MCALFEKQLSMVRAFVKRGVPGVELPLYWLMVVPSFMGLELNALHPFGKDIVALLESCEGRCTDPSDCGEWYESADWSVARTQSRGGKSSKDGLHHNGLKPFTISHVQALLSLALASMHKTGFDLSWLNTLPSADDTKLHDCGSAPLRFVNTRVSIAEVLEWQERNEEAIRCVCVLYPPHTHTPHLISQHLLLHCWHIYNYMLTRYPLPVPSLLNNSFAQAEIQDCFDFNVSSKIRAGLVLGRCHAALGKHTLSVSAFDAAISQAKRSRFLFSEALAVRSRVLIGRGSGRSSSSEGDNAGSGSGLHWDEDIGKQRLQEMMGRMQGVREPLERLLGT
jgi:hypothetical protein